MKSVKTKIVGILNVTPDSFYDQGNFFSTDQAIAQGIKLYNEGADILDIGGESTKPFADKVSEKEELNRVIPVIKALKNCIPIPISIDTMKPSVAAAAIESGAGIINDVSGLRDPEMLSLAVKTGVKLCVMHMKGTPQDMQSNPVYPNGVIEEVASWFNDKIIKLKDCGIQRENIILDPGIGFGKTVEDNYNILQNLHEFKRLGFPILLGLSRKSLFGKVLDKPPEELLAPTIAMNTLLMRDNIDYIRVHDVKEHRSIVEILNKLTSLR